MANVKMEHSRTSEDVLRDIVLDWRALKPRRQKRRKFKDYQEQLLKEIPGAADRTNVAMHAVIDVTTADGENITMGMGATTEIRNQALIHYIARLASSNSDDDEFDFSFVESLLDNGADINTADKYGQTMFHEVARSWDVDVARFLLNKGANINRQDKYGRAPLHVAAAVDYTEMIEFLLQHKADLDITTFGELQTPIHFAAKNDACQALKLLINYGANVNCRDYQNRTPIQVAASMSRTKAARFLVELGTPTGVYDHNGEMTLSLLILKMPEVATHALDQFRSQDMINRKEYNFLNYVEGPRIHESDPRQNKARSPLDVAIQYEQYSIVMHPVIKRLINVKWEFFGKKGARNDLAVNVVFAFVWTILGITMPLKASQLYLPLQYSWWRLLFALVTLSLTVFEFYKHVSSFVYMNRAIRRWKAFRERTLWNDKRFCHPKWRDENEYLDKEIKEAREERFFTRQDGWIFLDWIALLLVLSGIASHISFLVLDSRPSRYVHVRIVAFVLIVLYIRLLKFTRPFEAPGPFVASIAPMLKDFMKWCVLFLLLFIPYASIFWMVFGPTNEKTPPFMSDIPALIFTVFSMAAFSNLSMVDDLVVIDKNMARILIGSFVAISTIVILNLLIAMLADTFTRMYENSLETATMQRAKTILYLEQKLPSSLWQQYCEHIKKECSPEVCSLSEEMCIGRRDKIKAKEKFHSQVEGIHSIMTERFCPKVGKEKSDMDQLLLGMKSIQDELTTRGIYRRNLANASPIHVNVNIILDTAHADLNLNSDNFGRHKKDRNGENEIEKLPGNESESETTLEQQRESRNLWRLPAKSGHSHDRNEVSVGANTSIQRQLDVILNLVTQEIRKGKSKIQMDGKALGEDGSENKDCPPPLLHSDSGSEPDGKTVEPFYMESPFWQESSALSPTVDGASVMRNSSLDLYTSEDLTEKPSAELSNVTQHSLPIASRARHEGGSFVSTSSTEGSTTCDESLLGFGRTNVVLSSSESSQETATVPETEGKIESRSSYRRTEARGPMFSRASDCSNSSFSDYDVGTSENEEKIPAVVEIAPLYSGSVHRSGGSSQGTEITESSSSDDDSSASSQHTSALEMCYGELRASTGSQLEFMIPVASPVQRVPHVRWADSATGPITTPFVDIREISTSPSDHLHSAGTCVGSDTASGDEGHSGIDRATCRSPQSEV